MLRVCSVVKSATGSGEFEPFKQMCDLLTGSSHHSCAIHCFFVFCFFLTVDLTQIICGFQCLIRRNFIQVLILRRFTRSLRSLFVLLPWFQRRSFVIHLSKFHVKTPIFNFSTYIHVSARITNFHAWNVRQLYVVAV